MKKLEITITSAPDRENLVAEIWLQKKMIAEVNSEGGTFNLELYHEGQINVPLDDFLKVLTNAKNMLADSSQSL
jgi:hypothetical protein